MLVMEQKLWLTVRRGRFKVRRHLYDLGQKDTKNCKVHNVLPLFG